VSSIVPGLRQAVFVISADYARFTGGWAYDSRLLTELRGRGWTIPDAVAPAGFPTPDAAAIAATARLLSALPDRTLVLSDQLVVNVLPDIMEAEAERLVLVPIVHHPLALEGGLAEDVRAAFAQKERRALAAARLVITTSSATADTLAGDYGVPRARMITARPGFDKRPASGGSRRGPSFLLNIGAVVPRKDHGTLIAALSGLRDRDWRLAIVGNTTRAADHVAALRAQIAASGLGDRVDLVGELDQDALGQLWPDVDLFVSSSIHEGFGMAVGEAIGRGVPVVTTEAGAVTEWLDRRAGIVVGVGDPDTLRSAIARVLDEPKYREQLRQGALQARNALPSWAEAGAIVDQALLQLT